MHECLYCDAIEKGYFEFERKNNVPSNADLKNRILYETENFLVFPSIGQIIEGYLLIASKKHFLGIGQVPQELHDELNSVCQKVREILTNAYGTPLFFEHGPISEREKGGCCITHTHIHVIPVQVDILPDLIKHFKYRKIKSFNSLKKQFSKGVPYFFYESNSGEKYLFDIPDIVPSQYVRKIIAAKIGKPEYWNWQTYLGIEKLLKTTERLKDKFVIL